MQQCQFVNSFAVPAFDSPQRQHESGDTLRDRMVLESTGVPASYAKGRFYAHRSNLPRATPNFTHPLSPRGVVGYQLRSPR